MKVKFFIFIYLPHIQLTFLLEDVKDRLAELEAQLSQERKLREEAENAIADIRRECRAPFVVPSLLDAFRQISELTTRAMEP